MIDIVLEIAKKKLFGYDYEIFFLKNKKLKSESHDLKVDKVIASEDIGFSIRVIKSGRQGFAYSTTFDRKSVEDTVQTAKHLCNVASVDEFLTINGTIEKTRKVEYFDLFASKLPVEEKILKSVELEKLVREFDDRIKSVRKSTFIENIYEKYLINSLGLEIKETGTLYTAMVSAVASYGNESQIAWGYNSKRFMSDLDLQELAKETVYNAVSLLGAGSISTKNMYVLFPPYAMVELLDTFYPAFLGDALYKGKTLFKDRINQKVASDQITLIDDGTLEKGVASSSYDDEGVAKRKTTIIENGVFKTFLHNLISAKKTQSNTTGNSVRTDFRQLPSVGITNFYIEKSDKDINRALQDFDEVFYVIDMMGLHTADPISGNFSVGVNGLILSKGEVVKAVRGAAIAGNILDILNQVVVVGSDLKFYSNLGSPSVLVEKVTVAGD